MKPGMIICFLVLLAGTSCSQNPQTPAPPPDRESLIPPEQAKIIPETDIYPPRSLTGDYSDPVPLPYPVNTAGGGGFRLRDAGWKHTLCLVYPGC